MIRNFSLNFSTFLIAILANIFFIINTKASEPIVILNYSSNFNEEIGINSNNKFITNPGYSSKHKVAENETLGHILYAYYGDSGLNLRIVEMAIVEFNPKSFRNRNPNYLFANKTLYLPSLNQMKDLVLGKTKSKNMQNNSFVGSSQIYFFGG